MVRALAKALEGRVDVHEVMVDRICVDRHVGSEAIEVGTWVQWLMSWRVGCGAWEEDKRLIWMDGWTDEKAHVFLFA